jgi:hypothetical protein
MHIEGIKDQLTDLVDNARKLHVAVGILRHSKYADDFNTDKLDSALEQLGRASDCLQNANIELMAAAYQMELKIGVASNGS